MSTLFHGYKKLKSGDLTLLYKEGEIRQVSLGRVQILNAVYAAVRDQNWTTIPYKVREESIDDGEDGFLITLALEYSLENILFTAEISIEALGNKLLIHYKGKAGSSFLRNRIGLCILHPIKECRGKAVSITHPDGSKEEGRFPELISPDQPFFSISGMSWNPGKGIAATLGFEGEVFEAEDQRNWTDASYKTYCTPLEKPFPVQVEKGEQVDQKVTLEVETTAESDQPSASGSASSSPAEKRILSLHPELSSPLPALGLGRSTEAEALARKEAQILYKLHFHHYRVDLHLSRGGWKVIYDSVAKEQGLLGWPLELALHFGANPEHELESFLETNSSHPLNISRFLVFDQDFLSPDELLKQVLPGLRRALPDIPVGGGTDANFAKLNRFPPDPDLLDFVSYSICPQIHAFDNLTLVENLGAQADSVQTALHLLGKNVSIGAITLKQRFNAVATDEEEGRQAKPESDSRQHSSFTAGWILGSIRNLALAGASSLTYFETVGPRGILSRKDAQGRYSPLYHVFREILSEDRLRVIHTSSSHPLEFDGLAIQGKKDIKWLLANYTESELNIEMEGLPAKALYIFRLDDQGWIQLPRMEPEMRSLSLKPTSIYILT